MPPTVQFVFASLPARAGMCLDCLVTKTNHRFEDIEQELEGMGATFGVGSCAGCDGSGPVFALKR